MICSDAELSGLDSKLASAFSGARSSASPEQKTKLLQEQKAWLATRNQCQDASCVRSVYQARLNALSVSVPPALASTSPAPAPSAPPTAPPSANPSAPRAQTPESLDPDAAKTQFARSLGAADQLQARQVGFKDFRLGASLIGVNLAGPGKCTPGISFAPKDNPGISEAVLTSAHAHWSVFDDLKACKAETTVFEKKVSVSYRIAGPEATLYLIELTMDAEDLPLLSSAITKALGEPKETVETFTREQVAAAALKEARAKCDEQEKLVHAGGVTLFDEQIRQCYEVADKSTQIGLSATIFPPGGVKQTHRVWRSDEFAVGYFEFNNQSDAKVVFELPQLAQSISQLAKPFMADMERLRKDDQQSTDARRAKDF
jgi:hypothetical protein